MDRNALEYGAKITKTRPSSLHVRAANESLTVSLERFAQEKARLAKEAEEGKATKRAPRRLR